MKRGAPLRRFTPLRSSSKLETRTPLRSRGVKVGGANGSRSKAETLKGTGAQPLVALEGQQGTKFPKPAPRSHGAPARLRRSPMRKGGTPKRLSRPGSDPVYLEEVRKLPCRVRRPWGVSGSAQACSGDVVAHHAGPKSNDSTAVPLCWEHHQQWHDGTGVFDDWRKPERREWAATAIAETRTAVRERTRRRAA